MKHYYRRYIGKSVITAWGDIVQIVAVDYEHDYMYGYSDGQQEYVVVHFENNRIVRNIAIERLRTMAEEGRVYTD